MSEGSTGWRAALAGADSAAISTWLLLFGLVSYLGLESGGFDPLVHDRVAIATWALLLVGVLIGALPRRGLGKRQLAAFGLLGGFVAWTALSLLWTESAEQTAGDLARLAGYIAVFALVLATWERGAAGRTAGAIVAATAVVSGVALLSRMEPSWFPEASQTAAFVSGGEGRLSFPIDYWNGLGALVAIVLPLAAYGAAAARDHRLRALSSALLPLFALTLFLTLSRSGIGAAVIAFGLFVALAARPLRTLVAVLPGMLGAAVLIIAALQRDAFREGVQTRLAEQEGAEMFWLAIGVCLGAGLLRLAAGRLLDRAPQAADRAPFATRRRALLGLALGFVALAAIGAGVAFDAPQRAESAWEEFKYGGRPDGGTARLGSVAGQNRYQYWSSAVRANATEPLLGTGSGTFEFWWGRDGDLGDTIRDTHSLYMQTIAELGIVGIALLAAFLIFVFICGALACLRGGVAAAERCALAAALAGCLAFCLTAVFDWVWQMPVLGVVLMMLAALLVSAADRRDGLGFWSMGWGGRVTVTAISLAVLAAIAIPYSAASLLRDSEAAARSGDLSAAYSLAGQAEAVFPGAASPYLQQALLLEELGAFRAGAEVARAAVGREPTNWRTWLVLSRLEARSGRPVKAVHAYREARRLNTHSLLLEP